MYEMWINTSCINKRFVSQLFIHTTERKTFLRSACLQPEDSGIQEVKRVVHSMYSGGQPTSEVSRQLGFFLLNVGMSDS
jgi:hypothetical protein